MSPLLDLRSLHSESCAQPAALTHAIPFFPCAFTWQPEMNRLESVQEAAQRP